MKKIILAAVVLLVLLVTVGCSLSKTYSYSLGGICVEITTTDTDVMRAAEYAGYDLGPCSSDGVVGICDDYASIGGETWGAYFYETSYTAAEAELTCQYLNGTWTAN